MDLAVESILVRKVTLVIILTFSVITIISCSMSQNYNDPIGPLYEGSYAGEPPPFDGSLKVVTWNLRHGEHVEEAIETLTGMEELRAADVLLLQEMDEVGVEKIAREMSYNYVYYPTIVRSRQGRLQGNAILSKWPIRDHSKIILPKFYSGIMQTRIAVQGTILVEGAEIDVYSVHLETIWLLPLKINSQADYLYKNIDPDRKTIVGGDFNSWNDLVIIYLEQLFGQTGLLRVSAGTGYTFETTGLRLTLDHIFSSHVKEFEAGVWRGTHASDHYPLWAVLRIGEEQ